MVAKTDEPFTEILPAVKLRDCTRAIFNSLGDFFTISQPVLTDPSGQPGYRFFVAMLIVKNKKPGYSRPLHQNMALDSGAGWRGIPCRDRSCAANDDPGTHCKLS